MKLLNDGCATLRIKRISKVSPLHITMLLSAPRPPRLLIPQITAVFRPYCFPATGMGMGPLIASSCGPSHLQYSIDPPVQPSQQRFA